MELKHILRMIYDMGKMDGIEIGRKQVLEEDLIRLGKQHENIERDLFNGHKLLSQR